MTCRRRRNRPSQLACDRRVLPVQSVSDDANRKPLSISIIELDDLVRMLAGEYRVQRRQDHCYRERVVQGRARA